MTSATTLRRGAVDQAARAQASSLPRVLFVGDHVGYPGGVSHGLATYYRTVLPSLVRRGYETTLCVLGERHPVAASIEAEGAGVIFLGDAKWDPRSLGRLRKVSRRLQPHILHLCNFKAMTLGSILARESGTPAVLHFHDRLGPPKLLLPLMRYLARRADVALAVSGAVRDFTSAAYRLPKDRLTVLPNGIDLATVSMPSVEERVRIRARLGLAENAPVIATVGRLIVPKRVELVIESMPAVLAAQPHAVLLVIGDGPERRTWEKLAARLELERAVRFLGVREDVGELLAAADLLALASKDEGLPYVLLEAAARAIPAVAFAVGGVPEIVLDEVTGLLVANEDKAAFSEALVRLATDGALARRLGGAAREQVRRFDAELHLEALSGVYAELMAGKS